MLGEIERALELPGGLVGLLARGQDDGRFYGKLVAGFSHGRARRIDGDVVSVFVTTCL